MKGLLRKDFYTIIRQLKLYLVLVAVFACVPGGSMAAFTVVYAAMLPFTALAYDERAGWDMLAAVGCLADCALRGEEAWMADAGTRMTVLAPGGYTLHPLGARKLSLLAFTEEVTGVCLSGTEWPLEGAVLESRFPLGISNEFREGEAQLSFERGLLMVCLSED